LKGSSSQEPAGQSLDPESKFSLRVPAHAGSADQTSRVRSARVLQTTETTSNTVRNDIARATAAPHPNADGPPATERAHAPL
jgi:hypothetical protein